MSREMKKCEKGKSCLPRSVRMYDCVVQLQVEEKEEEAKVEEEQD